MSRANTRPGLRSAGTRPRRLGGDSHLVFHVTPASNLESILALGLVPSIGPLSKCAGETLPRVYLFATLEAAETALTNWLGDMFDEEQALSLLVVDVAGLAVDASSGFEISCTVAIAPSRIAVAVSDLDATRDLAWACRRAARLLARPSQPGLFDAAVESTFTPGAASGGRASRPRCG